MKVWKIIDKSLSRGYTYTNIEDNSHPIHSNFNGKSLINHWSTYNLEVYRKGKYSDFSMFDGGIPIISEKVYTIIQPLLGDQVEFLQAVANEDKVFIINVTNLLDCVDKTKSEVKPGGKLVFSEVLIPNHTLMFKTPEDAPYDVYVTDAFVEIYKRNKFKGLDFIEIWDSGITPQMEAEREVRYFGILNATSNSSGTKYPYEEARELVQQGKSMASGEWKIQLDKQGRLCLGQLNKEAQYLWIHPTYIPPILLTYQWVEVEKG